MAAKAMAVAALVAMLAGAAVAAPSPADAAVAAAADVTPPSPCAPTFNWFPTADELGGPQIVNNQTCAGDKVCNFPDVWGKANQTQYLAQLNTTLARGMLKVAYGQFGSEKPRLFFTPSSPFLTEGSDFGDCLTALLGEPAAARRRLMQSQFTVSKPGKWSYRVAYDGKPAQPGKRIADKGGSLDPAALNQDGDHCADVTLIVDGFEVSPPIEGFPASFQRTEKVCWYKTSAQPTAKFTFDMCTTKKFTVNVTNIRPLAQPLTQNGTLKLTDAKGQPAMLFQPVIHLFGRKNRTLDGTVLHEIEYDAMNNPINFVNKYITLPNNFTERDMLSFVLDEDSLDEGYYKLSAKVSMVTPFPDLVDLAGETRIVQADSYGGDVRGYTEFLGVTLVNETETVGVQKSRTTISQITSDRVNKAIQAGDAVTFQWRFAGIGTEKCFHDDKPLAECSSPMKVTAGDFSGADSEHTFRVVFTDVCGNVKEAKYAYTQKGVTAISKVDYVPLADAVLAGKGGKGAPRNGAAAALSAGKAAAAATLAAAAALLL